MHREGGGERDKDKIQRIEKIKEVKTKIEVKRKRQIQDRQTKRRKNNCRDIITGLNIPLSYHLLSIIYTNKEQGNHANLYTKTKQENCANLLYTQIKNKKTVLTYTQKQRTNKTMVTYTQNQRTRTLCKPMHKNKEQKLC